MRKGFIGMGAKYSHLTTCATNGVAQNDKWCRVKRQMVSHERDKWCRYTYIPIHLENTYREEELWNLKPWLDENDDSPLPRVLRSAPNCVETTRKMARLWDVSTCGTKMPLWRPGRSSVALLVLAGCWRCIDTTGSKITRRITSAGGIRTTPPERCDRLIG